MQDEGVAQRLAYHTAKVVGGVDIAISDEVAATDNSAGNGAKDGLHEVTDIDESNQLATVAETQLYMAAYRVNQLVVTEDARGLSGRVL